MLVPVLIVFGILVAAYFLWDWKNGKTTTRAPKLNPVLPRSPGGAAGMGEDESKPLATVVFGSQTGTAEMFAGQLCKEGRKFGFRTRCVDLMDYTTDDLETENIIIFVVSTYGEGEPTDSAKEFFDWFKQQEADMLSLSKVSFCVFGLGDSQYKLFNAMGRLTDTKMEQLGAKRIFRRGEGDADKNLEEEFENWRSEVWPAFSAHFGTTIEQGGDAFALERTTTMRPYTAPASATTTEWHPFPQTGRVFANNSSFGPRDPSQRPWMCPVIENRELLTCDGRNTRHVEISLQGTNIKYEAGDHLAIYAPNPEEVVEKYLAKLDLQGHSPDSVVGVTKNTTGRLEFPTRCSIRNALRWYLDLTYHPKKETLKAFTNFTADEKEKENFQSVLQHNDEALQKYKRLVENLGDTHGWLRKFGSTSVPIDVFLEMMPRMQPRYYSIASDGLAQPQSIYVCAAVMPKGLVTNHLLNAKVGDRICAYVRRSNFHLPRNAPQTPLVLVGPGTGIAPFVGFLHRRRALREQGKTLGPCIFFFGCRRRDEDYLYKSFLEECAADGTITTLHIAFSREQDKKVYVQHLIQEDAENVWKTIHDLKGALYICGDAKHMARDVEATLKQIGQARSEALKSTEAIEQFLEGLAKNERYLKDVWSTHN